MRGGTRLDHVREQLGVGGGSGRAQALAGHIIYVADLFAELKILMLLYASLEFITIYTLS